MLKSRLSYYSLIALTDAMDGENDNIDMTSSSINPKEIAEYDQVIQFIRRQRNSVFKASATLLICLFMIIISLLIVLVVLSSFTATKNNQMKLLENKLRSKDDDLVVEVEKKMNETRQKNELLKNITLLNSKLQEYEEHESKININKMLLITNV